MNSAPGFDYLFLGGGGRKKTSKNASIHAIVYFLFISLSNELVIHWQITAGGVRK
jgi:hypothetical protein